MEFFRKQCPYCGKENPVSHPRAEGFCNRVCEANFKYEKKYKQKVNA